MQPAEREEKAAKAPGDCDRDLGCLKEQETFPLCQVEKPVADLLFVTAKPLPSCRHLRYFGKGAYCTCPVRKELFRRHKL
jgi:hypothetical protein